MIHGAPARHGATGRKGRTLIELLLVVGVADPFVPSTPRLDARDGATSLAVSVQHVSSLSGRSGLRLSPSSEEPVGALQPLAVRTQLDPGNITGRGFASWVAGSFVPMLGSL